MKTCVLKTGLAASLLGLWANSPIFALARLEPAEGCYLGFVLGKTDTIARLGSRLGISPAVYVQFFDFPIPDIDRASLTNFLSEVLLNGGIALITLEPWDGLDPITQSACADLGTLCAAYEQLGIDGVIIRFAHEMNGNWYPWGQQPLLYKQKFRLLAQNVHSLTARTAVLWAPNYGVGYPFGAPRAVPGSPDFAALDTNGDGVLSPLDDMYEPYYPGDDAVDWVGMTLYHWGVNYPWFENEMPLPNSFANSLTGTYQGATPNFYARYCVDGVHNKPMAVPETAAFYNTQQPGPGEFNLKQAWWQQVFKINGDTTNALDVALHFPKLKCIDWFDQYKQEVEAQTNWIDWRVSVDQRLRAAFVGDVTRLHNGRPYFLTAQEARWQRSDYAVTASSLPHILPLAGSIPFSLNAKAATPCDLVVDLLDANFQWQGGTRLLIAAGTQTVSASLPLVRMLQDGGVYRWSIFLTPTGSNYQQALAWYKGPPPVARWVNPAIEIVALPPVVPSPATVNVRVKCIAAEPAVAIVNAFDNASRRIGGGSVAVGQGDGCEDVPIALPAAVTSGSYLLEALLSDSSTNSQTPMARSQKMPLLVSSSVDRDIIQAAAEPSIVPVGEVFRFAVAYAAISNRDLHIDLFDASTNYLASAFQPVPSGSGIRDLTISFPKATPGEYFITAFMTPTGQSWNQEVAWGAEQRLTVIGLAYQTWIELHWGVVLQNDLIHPQDDPDGDGASNAYEFLTRTDPRNAADVLKVKITRIGAGSAVTWPSVAGLSYQLLESSSASAGLWTPVGTPLTGTGTALEVPISPERVASFYRVHLLP